MNRLLICILLMAAGTCCPRPVAAAAEVNRKLAELAAEVLRATKNQPVTVGVFSPTGLSETNSGPGIEGILHDELERLAVGLVRDDARFEVKGDYAFAMSRNSPNGELKVIKITARIIDMQFAEDLLTIPLRVELDHTQSLAAVLQPTARLEPDPQKAGGTKVERNAELDRSVQDPRVHIHGTGQTLVSSAAESRFSVELLVSPLKDRQQAKPRRAVEREGMAFVEIDRGELYEVRIHNSSADEVAVRLSVDGLDMYHFSEDRKEDGTPRFTHTIIQPKTAATIVGWHKSVEGTENYRSFLVTGYGEGAVSQAKSARGKVGVIHVQFARCSQLPEGAYSRGGNETGFGPPRQVSQKPVRYSIEPPHDVVSVWYTR
ncbi:MAG: hypothetical protein KDA79_21800 [Planctomycetaceae bacterium]|nr:hypothetical protein [Planctomycetaceae bacterium]